MLRYLTAGESHGEALIGIVEGMPAGVPLTEEIINYHLARRWLGFGRGGRAKFEQDQVHIYSGVRFSKTIASPIAMRLDNAAYTRDKSGWPEVMALDGDGKRIDKITLPRPGHADLEGVRKYGFDDIRPVIDRASARETAMRVACCTIARQLLKQFGIEVGSHVVQIGKVGWGNHQDWYTKRDALLSSGAEALNDVADQSQVRMLDSELSSACVEHIQEVKRSGDSLGGIYEVVVTGVPPGLGTYVHWDRRLGGQLAQAILSIQAQKGVEIGDGIANTARPGSQVHDEIYLNEAGDYRRRSNHAGGLEGGMTNGMPIIVRGYMKPIPTLIKPLETVDMATGETQPTRYERSDVTSVPAASTVAEATVAWVIANAFLEKHSADSLDEMLDHFERASR
ncbi:MAG: chorismate synthase [Bacteroidetes bacterium]|nr:chorismate synthase [Bacteroidota bacterium]MCY4205773.1 chorismate synthase [Bacteroidota bacterium]